MTFEGKGLRVIVPLDPSQGERYTEPVIDEDQDVLDHIYNITAKEEDYVNPTTEGIMDWQCDNSCMTDSDEGLENWKNRLYELHGHRCARITKFIKWVGLAKNLTYFWWLDRPIRFYCTILRASTRFTENGDSRLSIQSRSCQMVAWS